MADIAGQPTLYARGHAWAKPLQPRMHIATESTVERSAMGNVSARHFEGATCAEYDNKITARGTMTHIG
eukprot:8035384-Pyramimonas_sp.AAC.1